MKGDLFRWFKASGPKASASSINMVGSDAGCKSGVVGVQSISCSAGLLAEPFAAIPLSGAKRPGSLRKPMHYDAHQPVINDLEARITTIRDSL